LFGEGGVVHQTHLVQAAQYTIGYVRVDASFQQGRV
jgi:hypothetical protein